MTQISDGIFAGNAETGTLFGNSAGRGVGPVGRTFNFDIVPVTSGNALLAALQTTGGATPLALTAGAGVTTRVDAFGVTRYVLDHDRRVTLTSAANLSAINFTAVGYDRWGQRLTSTIAGPNANTVAFPKAMKELVSITPASAVGSNVSAGFNDSFGLPFRVTNAAYIVSAKWDNTLADNAGTLVVADQTTPATATTGDVRGVFTPAGAAANGSRRLLIVIALPAIAAGEDATRIGALGVTQV